MQARSHFHLFFLPLLATLLFSCVEEKQASPASAGISVSENEKNYFLYHGEKILLLGGSNDDNLFQRPDLFPEIDSLAAAGGNYLRCTLSSRDSSNIWAFAQGEEGRYNLRQFNPDYWQRLADFLAYCAERDVVVQIEVWATFDFHKEFWAQNPFNPKNNRNYNELRSKLDSEFAEHPAQKMNDFFRSVPHQLNTPVLLRYQQAFVDKLLSISLPYDNVLYCMDNETSANADWGSFWARYIKDQAWYEYGKKVLVTEMWDPWELRHPLHGESFFHPEIYDFVEISQNNHNSDQAHWQGGIEQFRRLEQRGCLRPVTNIKVYGADGGRHQTTNNAIESFIRNVLMGCASTRFHRPTSGLGWGEIPKRVIRSIRMLEAECDLLSGEPDTTDFTRAGGAELYVRRLPSGRSVLFIPTAGEVHFDLAAQSLKVLDILQNQWVESSSFLEVKQERLVAKRDYLLIVVG